MIDYSLDIQSCIPSIMATIRSNWGMDDWEGGWGWDGWGSRVRGLDALALGWWDEPKAAEDCPMGVARERVFDSLFGVLEKLFFAFFVEE